MNYQHDLLKKICVVALIFCYAVVSMFWVVACQNNYDGLVPR